MADLLYEGARGGAVDRLKRLVVHAEYLFNRIKKCCYRPLLLSKVSRLSTMADWWVRTQRTRWSTAWARGRPSAGSSYSTRGGTSGRAVRVIRPSRCSVRRVWLSIRWEMPVTLWCRAVKRIGPDASAV